MGAAVEADTVRPMDAAQAEVADTGRPMGAGAAASVRPNGARGKVTVAVAVAAAALQAV